ncbi:cysteine desulfurase family protein [Methylomonas rapida]|uniref:cysteine desulfurase n=1 Tax=Methylomonas rapida TaxID=2963939 RepID=A0ABY7GE54_9GAMM|nr:cysteine desulfurase family protein [Methylomonas rapida]WAR43554.1 cysteine desulfurase family protein [Methylomonas rapida]
MKYASLHIPSEGIYDWLIPNNNPSIILANRIYLDYAATTPMAPEAVKALCGSLTLGDNFANPASLQHNFGERAHERVENARTKIATCLKGKPSDLIFTSGATESNNLAIKGIALGYRNKGQHIITSASEHKAVLDTCKYLESIGFGVTYLRPDMKGKISVDQVLSAITSKTILVSLMHVNNETGVINDIHQLAKALEQKDVFFHVDAAQSAGKLSIDLSESPIDLLSLSGHKFYGPKGIGGLYVRNRKKLNLIPLFHGGGQEHGLRPGTLPTHQIAGMATAFELINNTRDADYKHATALARALTEQLSKLGDVYFNGDQEQKLPNIINVSFEQVSSESLIIALRDEVAIASGSACNSGAVEASHVLRSMGIEGDRLYGAVRISFGRYTTVDEITWAGQRIGEEVTRLRELALE